MSKDQNITRKLKAILSADVKGYSLLMSDDEVLTLKTLDEYKGIMSELIKSQSGRVVDSVGDNVLAEFSSAVDAVECAIEIQKRLKKENAKFVDERKLEFRIGINIGDVIHQEGRIVGEGVNIASRIEGLADAGGICISRNAYDHVKNKLQIETKYMGEHEVKNIKEPVRVYRVLLDSDAYKPLVEEKYDLPDKPSIAVLPFTNMSGDPSQEYFSDGLTEQIINGLCKARDLFVIARNSSFAYKGKTFGIKQIAKELGVKYILEGSVQKAGNRVRITAQLIDAMSDYHMWSENYDRNLEDIFALQDEITLKLINAMAVNLTEGEQARLWSVVMPKHLKAYDALMRGNECSYRLSRKDNILARKLYNEAINIEPTASMPFVNQGFTHLIDMIYGWTDSPLASFEKAEKYAKKSHDLFNDFDLANLLQGWILFFKSNFEGAIDKARRSIELNPNGAMAHIGMAFILTHSGETIEAVKYAKMAIRLNPYPPIFYYHILGIAYRNNGQFKESIDVCKHSLLMNADMLNPYITMASSYGLSGKIDKAKPIVKKLLTIEPIFSVGLWSATMPYKNKNEQELIADALRKAGLPD